MQSAHFIGWGQFEDRSKDGQAFVTHLLCDAGQANPALVVLSGAPFGTWLGWLAATVFCVVLATCGLFILPAGLALIIASLTALFQAWRVLEKRYANLSSRGPSSTIPSSPERVRETRGGSRTTSMLSMVRSGANVLLSGRTDGRFGWR